MFARLAELSFDEAARQRLWRYYGQLGLGRAAELRWHETTVEAAVGGRIIARARSSVTAAVILQQALHASDDGSEAIWMVCCAGGRVAALEVTRDQLSELAAGRPVRVDLGHRVAWRRWMPLNANWLCAK